MKDLSDLVAGAGEIGGLIGAAQGLRSGIKDGIQQSELVDATLPTVDQILLAMILWELRKK